MEASDSARFRSSCVKLETSTFFTQTVARSSSRKALYAVPTVPCPMGFKNRKKLSFKCDEYPLDDDVDVLFVS